MLMDFSQTPRVAPLHQALPWLIAANALLVLSSADLASLLAQEVAQNPALELDEHPVCPRCGGPLPGASCPDCVRLSPSSQFTTADDWQGEGSWPAGGAEEDPFDPLSLLVTPVDFRA
jgi:DNA-directed RNA polymerase specialized sigma54-like protein